MVVYMGTVACLILEWLKHKLCTSQKENKTLEEFHQDGCTRV